MKAKQTKFAVWYQHIFYSNFFDVRFRSADEPKEKKSV